MDRGWSVDSTQLFSETVTTAVNPEYPDDPAGAQLAYSGFINADSITVTYDGTEYTCPRINVDGADAYAYGGFNDGPDFTEYPFFIWSGDGMNQLITQTAGEHTVAASASLLQTSADFDTARGYGYVTGDSELFSETVTTAVGSQGDPIAQLAYSGIIEADSITVTFDGTEYTCPRIDGDSNYYYGGFDSGSGSPDFTTYPFFIWSSGGTNKLITQTAGEHTIAVTATVTSMQISADFSAAVNECVDASSIPLRCVSGRTEYSAMIDAQTDGRLMYFQHERKTYFAHSVGQTSSGNKKVKFFPENSGITVGFENNVFTVSTATESS